MCFSTREKEVIKTIGRKKITIREISDKMYKGPKFLLDPEIAIASTISRIIKKCSYYNLPWTLTKTRENKKLIIRKEKL